MHLIFLLFRLAGKEHLFEVVTPSRTFYVQVETDTEMEDWLKAFDILLKTSRSSQQVVFPRSMILCTESIAMFPQVNAPFS